MKLRVNNKTNVLRKYLILGKTMSLTGLLIAQSTDALLDKLVERGVITREEAIQLQKEQSKKSMEIKNKLQLPDWVQSLRISGDFGVRGDYITVNAPNTVDRFRPRYRFRIGTSVNLLDNMSTELRLASGESDRSPLASGYTTFQDNAAKKYIWIDRAYWSWTPIKTSELTGTLTVGKMVNPYDFTWVVFDPDYTPEGLAWTLSWRPVTNHVISITPGAFMIDELPTSSHDPYMASVQLKWASTWSTNLITEVKGAVFGLAHCENLDNGAVPNVGVGNTRTAAGQLAYNFNPIVIGAGITYLIDGINLYPGRLPVSLSGEIIHNPAAPSNNTGWDTGITIGTLSKKGSWALEYRYVYVESDAWYEEFSNDDSLAYYSIPISSGSKGVGSYSGTNKRGHYIAASYALTSSLSIGTRAYIHDLIDVPAGAINPTTYHVQVDLMVKF